MMLRHYGPHGKRSNWVLFSILSRRLVLPRLTWWTVDSERWTEKAKPVGRCRGDRAPSTVHRPPSTNDALTRKTPFAISAPLKCPHLNEKPQRTYPAARR